MRSKFLLLALAVCLVAALSLFASSRVTTANAQAASCTDKDYLTALGKDLTSLGNDLKAVDMTKASSIIGQELAISVLRQKYEDLPNVPDGCLTTNVLTLAYAANINDLLTLQTGLLADTANADVYNKALTAQADRVKKFGDLLTQTATGTK